MHSSLTANAVKAGLVDHAEEWIGWNSLDISLHGGSFQFTGLNRNCYNKASRNRKKRPDPKLFEETFEFALTPPLGYENESIENTANHIEPLLREQEAFHRGMRNNKPPLGIEAIKKQSPSDRPVSPSRSPKRRFACKDKAVLHERLEQYRLFTGVYSVPVRAFAGRELSPN